MEFKVADEKLAAQGKERIALAEASMPVLMKIRARFAKEKPLAGQRIAACLHVTKETAGLIKTLAAGGAHVRLTGSNPLSTQDDVAAALVSEGIEVFAWHGQNNDEYYECLNKGLDFKPTITLDDGADVINAIHFKRKDLLVNVIGGQEETTTGVIRLRAMEKAGALQYPVIAVNDTPTKHLFDNYYGTGQSTLDGIIRATNVLFAAKTVVVAGYGHCGKGVAERARGLGAKVIVTEVDAVKALQAFMDGFRVMPMAEAASIGNVFVTATGNKHVIRPEHFKHMANGSIVCNTGHFNIELDLEGLGKIAKKRTIKEGILDEYTLDGKKLLILAEGRLVNLAAAEGHPSEVMDMSFANQALVSEYLVKNAKNLEKKVYDVPADIDIFVAKIKLEALGLKKDELTPEQVKYLQSYNEGT